MPAEEACSACGGELSKLGEDVSEMLEYIPASFKVIRHVRPKMCCTRCDAIMQAPAPAGRSTGDLPDPACWRMFWYRSMQIIFPCIASRRSMLAKASIWIARRWPIGWELPAIYSRPWSINYVSMCSQLRRYTPMTRRFRCWRPAQARPKRRGSGPMCATIAQRAVMCRQLFGSPTRGSQGRTSQAASELLYRHSAGRCLCWISSSLRRRQDRRSRMLGSCAAQVL